MIVYENGIEQVNTNGVLYSNPSVIRKLAIMMMVSMAESNTDMVCDMSEEYPTKADVERVFQGLNDQALDMLDDHISDLRASLEKFLQEVKYTAKVRRLEYDQEGKLADITVDIDVE